MSESSSSRNRRKLLLITVAVGLAALIVTAATVDDFGITADEPGYFKCCLQQMEWFRQAREKIASGNWQEPFSAEILDRYWDYSKFYQMVGAHPQFYLLCNTLTLALFEGPLDPISAFRLSPVVMFSILLALLFLSVGRRYGIAAGFWAVGSFALMPRVFGHAHFAATDTPITLLWFASALSFHRALESRRWSVVFSLVYGLALATKFTALVIPLPLMAYVVFSRRFRQAAWPVGLALIVSPLVMVGLNPQWWHGTFERVWLYLLDNANRSDYVHIPTYYLGKVYTFYLPWHHSLVYTLFAVSPLVLTAFIYGCWRTLRRPFRDQWATHMLFHWLAVHLVMMLPGSPGHDGVRLFLPSFAFLAVISARGFSLFSAEALPAMLSRLQGPGRRAGAAGAWVLLCAMLVPSGLILARVHPYELCYYNSLAGGIPGAHRLGMETTYWWDPVNDTACRLINETVPDSAVVYCRNLNLYRFLQKLGRIKPSLRFEHDDYSYLLEDSRQGTFGEYAWILYERGEPLAELTKDGVRLFAIFKVPEAFEDILAGLKNTGSPEFLYEKAVMYDALGKPDSSYLVLKKYLEIRPADFKAVMRMAARCLDKRYPDEAAAYLEQVAGDPEDAQLWHSNMGTVYFQKGQYEQAIASFQQCLEYQRLDHGIRASIARIYYRMGRLEESAEQYKLVLRIKPYDQPALHMLSIIYHKLNDTAKARYYYDRLLDEDPQHVPSLVNRGLLEVGEGDYRQAGEFFLRALAVDSTDVSANFNLGNLYAQSGNSLLAEKHYRAVLAGRPDDIQAHQALALLLLRDPSRQVEALEHFRILAGLSPGQAEMLHRNYIRPLEERLAGALREP